VGLGQSFLGVCAHGHSRGELSVLGFSGILILKFDELSGDIYGQSMNSLTVKTKCLGGDLAKC